jgi:hypothetical protein
MHSITTGVVQCGLSEACRAGLLGVTRSEPGVPTLVWRHVLAQWHVRYVCCTTSWLVCKLLCCAALHCKGGV